MRIANATIYAAAALGLCFMSPQGAAASPATPDMGKAYTQAAKGGNPTLVRGGGGHFGGGHMGGVGHFGGARFGAVGARHYGIGRGFGYAGVRGAYWRGAGWRGGGYYGIGRGFGYGGVRRAYWRGPGWRGGYYGGWGPGYGLGWGWGWPAGLGLGLGVAATDWGFGGGWGYPGYYRSPAYFGGSGCYGW
jgi:hypothetical protein